MRPVFASVSIVKCGGAREWERDPTHLEGHVNRAEADEEDEGVVVLGPDARVEPLAVVVEAQDALVALGAVPAGLLDLGLAVAAIPRQLRPIRLGEARLVPWIDVAAVVVVVVVVIECGV